MGVLHDDKMIKHSAVCVEILGEFRVCAVVHHESPVSVESNAMFMNRARYREFTNASTGWGIDNGMYKVHSKNSLILLPKY